MSVPVLPGQLFTRVSLKILARLVALLATEPAYTTINLFGTQMG